MPLSPNLRLRSARSTSSTSLSSATAAATVDSARLAEAATASPLLRAMRRGAARRLGSCRLGRVGGRRMLFTSAITVDQLETRVMLSHGAGGDHHDDGHDHDGHDHAHDAPPETAPDYDITRPLTDYADRSITSLLLTFRGTSVAGLNMQRGINENTEMQAATPSIEINRVYETMGKGEAVLRQLALVIVAVSVLSIFIGLYTSLDRRRGELALLRSLGAGPPKLFGLLLTEGILLALGGAVLGLLLSHLGLALIARYFSAAYRQDFADFVWLPEEGWLLVGAVVVGGLAAVVPAARAARTEVAAALE